MSDDSTRAVTFLFSDIEGSTRLWETHGSAMESVLSQHDSLVADAVDDAGGSIFKHTGDGLVAAFASPAFAIRAAIDMQLALSTADWTPLADLRARVGIHAGVAQHRDGDYFGRSVNRCARLMSVASGGQIVVSGAAYVMLEGSDDSDWTLSPLGVHKLKDLSRPETVYEVRADGLLQDFPKLKTIEAHPTSLPRIRGRLIGQTACLSTIVHRLRSGRLTTLVGPSGVGKSRLAIDAAAAAISLFPDGAWYCSVRRAHTIDEFATAVANVMRIDIADPNESLSAVTAALLERRALLLIDGCEFSPDVSCDFFEELLDRCPYVSVLATSRERLRLRSGQIVIDPLETPLDSNPTLADVAASSAVSLFVDRAQNVAADFTLTEANRAAVAEICRRLDGLPLAIELAAAQTSALDPADILRRLERHESLKARGQQTTIEDAVAWAYDSLSEQHKTLFARLAPFDGGFDLAAAEAVCSDVDLAAADIAMLLSDLVDHSMMFTRRQDGTLRFWMLSLLRQFSLAKLESRDPDHAIADSHLHYFLDFAKSSAAGIRGRDEETWTEAVGAEFANIRAAFRHAMKTERLENAAELIEATYPYAFGRTRYEIVEWAEAVLQATGDDVGARTPTLLAIVAWGTAVRGNVEQSSALGHRAIDEAQQRSQDQFLAHRVCIVTSILQTDFLAAVDHTEQSLAAVAGAVDNYAEIELLGFYAFGLAHTGRFDEALVQIDDALQLARARGNPSLLAWTLYEFGMIESARHVDAAETALDNALELAKLVDNRYISGLILMGRTHLALSSSDVDRSLGAFDDVIEHWYHLANWTNLTNVMLIFANYLATHGHDDSAAVLIGGIVQRSPWSRQSLHYTNTISILEARQSEQDLATRVARGAALDMRGLVAHCQADITRLSL